MESPTSERAKETIGTAKGNSFLYRGTTLEPTGNPEIHDYGQVDDVVISGKHAQSLTAMVHYFQNMMQLGYSVKNLGRVEKPEREEELTSAYCDELLEDLGQ